MVLSRSFLSLGVLATTVLADGQYKSRPDLSPPRLNITIPATDDVAPGYLFLCPYSGFVLGNGYDGPEQPSGYIFRDNGDLVWSSMGYLSGWVGNMQVRTWKGEPVITAFQGTLDSFYGHGFGHPTILNSRYETLRELQGGNHKIISIHEFNLLDSSSALSEIYQPTPMDLSPYGGSEDAKWIVDSIFQEIDVETGKLLFEWSSLDHVDPSHSKVPLPPGNGGNGQNSTAAWDYFHINSVDKDDGGDYLISARHVSTVYKIDSKTGDIIWQLGGDNSSFSFPDELLFGFQHDARFVRKSETRDGIEYISIFDNAARANGHRGGGVDVVHDESRGKVIRLDTNDWTATLEISLTSPEGLQAPSQGNMQTLPNSNLFVSWGQRGAMTEYRASDGEVIFHAYPDSGEIGQGVQNYRGFRFQWKGYSNEAPAIVALKDSDGSMTIYASWNGDTETAEWRFYSAPESCVAAQGVANHCNGTLLGGAERTSFETSFTVEDAGFNTTSGVDAVYAEAFDGKGVSLVKTGAVIPKKAVL